MNEPDIQFTKFLLQYIKPKELGIFIECGANDGIAGSPCFVLEKQYKWSGVNVEANPYCFKTLRQNRPNSISVKCALSNKNKMVKFTLPTDGPRRKYAAQASVVYKHGHWKRGNSNRPTETFTVPAVRYDALLEKLNIIHVDLFVLDVEGAEELVLEGMTSVLPKFLCVEDNHKGNENLPNIIKTKGYTLIDRFKNNSLWRLDDNS